MGKVHGRKKYRRNRDVESNSLEESVLRYGERLLLHRRKVLFAGDKKIYQCGKSGKSDDKRRDAVWIESIFVVLDKPCWDGI